MGTAHRRGEPVYQPTGHCGSILMLRGIGRTQMNMASEQRTELRIYSQRQSEGTAVSRVSAARLRRVRPLQRGMQAAGQLRTAPGEASSVRGRRREVVTR